MNTYLGSIVSLFIVSMIIGAQPIPEEQLEKIAKIQIKALTQALEIFYVNNGEYPKKLKDLAEGERPIVKSANALFDPWKRPYRYDPTGPKNKGERPDIWTVTPAKKIIGNWPQE